MIAVSLKLSLGKRLADSVAACEASTTPAPSSSALVNEWTTRLKQLLDSKAMVKQPIGNNKSIKQQRAYRC